MRANFEAIRQLFDDAVERQGRGEFADKAGKSPDESRAFGEGALYEGDYESAITHFREAVAQSSETSPWTLMELGAAYATAGRVPEAFRQYEKARRIQKSGELLIALSSVFQQYGGRAHEALDTLVEASRLEPENAFVHYKLAEALRRYGFKKDAVTAVRVAVACAPDQSFYHYWLGELLLELGSFVESAEALHAALELAPGDDELFCLAAQALWGTGKKDEAVRAVRLASDLAPKNGYYRGLLVSLLRAQGATEQAEVEAKGKTQMDDYDRASLARALERIGLRTLA